MKLVRYKDPPKCPDCDGKLRFLHSVSLYPNDTRRNAIDYLRDVFECQSCFKHWREDK